MSALIIETRDLGAEAGPDGALLAGGAGAVRRMMCGTLMLIFLASNGRLAFREKHVLSL